MSNEEEARSPKLVVVANRLPGTRVGEGAEARWEQSTGGLVTALVPILKGRHGAWIGWTGEAGKSEGDFEHDGMSMRTVSMTEAEVETYYNGFSNRTLWPLYHDAIRAPEFDHSWWWPYVTVNERFAKCAAEAAGPGDTVWVHDYHLQLVPSMLRKLRPDLRIGVFMHIPFPPEELFSWLPWRREVLEGLLGADLIGFQIASDARNFSRAARMYTEAEGTDTTLEFGGRRVKVNAYPISIDMEWFESRARDPVVRGEAQTIRKQIGAGRKILLSIDRLDYTKGVDHRLVAYELMLRRKQATIDDCVLVQIAAPSRETIFEYAEQRTKIEQIVGRINGEFSVPGRVAVHYFRRAFTREELMAYYVAADVMVVTPLRDGMNLVAKEYVASRVDGSGVLVLSEFAGAARQLRRSLLVNPRDVEGMAARMGEAMTLETEDARRRMAIMRTMVRRHDVHEWAEGFLEAMGRGDGAEARAGERGP